MLVSFGANAQGQLGMGDTSTKVTPTLSASTSASLTQVACGSRATVAIDREGKVFGVGTAQNGLLGDVDDDHYSFARLIACPMPIAQIALRGSHVLALSTTGVVFAWGRGDDGQLGLGTSVDVKVPTKVNIPLAVAKVACGRMHSVCVDVDGGVWSFGAWGEGQTGLGRESNVPQRVSGLPGPVSDVACGSRHSLVVCQGAVWGFGSNSFSQLGLGDREPRHEPKRVLETSSGCRIACGYRQSFAYVGGSLWGWGWNSHGQACPGSPLDVVPIPTLVAIAEPAPVEIAFVAGGGRHSLVMTTSLDGTKLWAFGRGASGELGLKGLLSARRAPRLVLQSFKLASEGLWLSAGWEHSAMVVPDAEFFPSLAARMSWGGDLNAGLAQFVNTIVLLRMLPPDRVVGAAMSVIVGNLALCELARGKGATALPHGLNAVALFALGAEQASGSAIFCTFWLGVLQIPCALTIAPYLKQHIPRPALLAAVAGVAVSFIQTNFAIRLFSDARAGLPALVVFLIGFGARADMPFGLPVAVVALAVGIIMASSQSQSLEVVKQDTSFTGLWDSLFQLDNYPLLVSVVLPLGIVNLVSNLACVEAARAAGDDFDGPTALLIDAVASVIGATVFGSPVPTCIYVGHASFKSMGATFAFPLVNCLLLALLAMDFAPLVAIVARVPVAAALGVLVWVGALVTAEGFKARRHGPAVALALGPSLAAWKGGQGGFGAQGYMLVSLLLGGAVTHVLDGSALPAAGWFGACCLLSQFGLIHRAPGASRDDIAQGYFACSVICLLWALRARSGQEPRPMDDAYESEAEGGGGEKVEDYGAV